VPEHVFGGTSIALNPVTYVLLTMLLFMFFVRTRFGHDGADQMSVIVFFALAICLAVGSNFAIRIGLWFVSLQSCLSYATAGFAKARSAGWRDGTYLTGIICTETYGHRLVASYLMKHTGFAKWLARIVVTWECMFPIVLLLPFSAAIVLLATGVVFHIGNSVIMGLNTFNWAFLGAYPALLWCITARGW
jgi:hypothetical protein